MKNDPIALPADPADAEDFDVTIEALDRGQRTRLMTGEDMAGWTRHFMGA